MVLSCTRAAAPNLGAEAAVDGGAAGGEVGGRGGLGQERGGGGSEAVEELFHVAGAGARRQGLVQCWQLARVQPVGGQPAVDQVLGSLGGGGSGEPRERKWGAKMGCESRVRKWSASGRRREGSSAEP